MGQRIELRELTRDNVYEVVCLKIKPEQKGFVATNANSLAEAYVSEGRAWARAICVEGKPVGFVMLDLAYPSASVGNAERTECWVWRLMIDAEHQGRGYGRGAMELVIAYVKTQTENDTLYLSHANKAGHAAPFYERLGFEATGEIDDGEVVMKMDLR